MKYTEALLSYLLQPQELATIVKKKGMKECLLGVAQYIYDDYLHWDEFDKSARVAKYIEDGVCELMPIADKEGYGFKYVNCHPYNPDKGMSTVLAFGALADMKTGMPYFIGEMTVMTAIRTAATSLLAARYLARKNSKVMAIIGNGCQSEFQALAFHYELGINTLHLYDTDVAASEKLKKNLAFTGMEIKIFSSVPEALEGADIVTTITAEYSRAHILKQEWIKPGMYINAVGGDSPGKTELEPEILRQADGGVYIEFEPQTRVEGELQNVEADFPVKALVDVFKTGKGRENDEQVIVFDSVGFALEDYSVLKYFFDVAKELDVLKEIRLVPNLENPKDLFSYIHEV
ncbi:ornithine cyclodeaminase [Basilea psittacipulmonis]|uniref:Ornithine cyclodeaminase n=1 Tax=Basilea psittacipulmonis DSM 24701 TaxID=1072685 RepID=A0A077DCR2_9BURK|nr:ornithine cyclodeaminase [Basilea psittacipulmonis]AIL31971.1 ornithine cyclodeaminase [Basilea psittacipulmonis DSM 24701]